MAEKKVRVDATRTKSGRLRARCPKHGTISLKVVGACETGPMFACHPSGEPDGYEHFFLRPWGKGERLGK